MASFSVNVIQVQQAFNAAIAGLLKIGVMNADGTFNTPTEAQDVALAALAETIAVEFGVKVPVKLDRAVQMLPLLLQLVG